MGSRAAMAATVAGLVLLAGGGAAAPGLAQVEPRATINFDDAPANRSGTGAAPALTDRYADLGVVFATPVTPLVIDADSIPAVAGFARSGDTVITTCYAAEFCSNRVEFVLARGHEAVELWAGYASPLPEPAVLVAEGFGPDGAVVDAQEVVLGPSERPIPVEVPVRLVDPAGGITTVVLGWADGSRFLSDLAIDDLGLTAFVPRIGLAADPAFLFLDGAAGPVSARITITNVGNVGAPIGDVAVDAGADAAGRLAVVAETCRGELDRAASCQVEVAYEPVPDEVATGVVVVTARDGSPLLEVDLEVAGPVDADPTDPDPADPDPTDPDPTDPDPGRPEDPTTAPTATATAGATAAGSPGALGDGDWPPSGWLLPAVLAGVAGVAIAWWRRRQRLRRRPRDRARPALPRIVLRARPDAGTQAVEPTREPVVSIRARMRPDRDRTTVQHPRAGEEGRPA